MDGTGRDTLASESIGWPHTLAVDSSGKVYYETIKIQVAGHTNGRYFLFQSA